MWSIYTHTHTHTRVVIKTSVGDTVHCGEFITSRLTILNIVSSKIC